jgi:hypothetical protein
MTISLFGHVCLAKTIDPELRHAKVGLAGKARTGQLDELKALELLQQAVLL